VIPPELFGRSGAAHAPLDPRAIALRRTSVYVLDTVSSHVSATGVRERLDRNESIHGLVPPRVEEYITKQAFTVTEKQDSLQHELRVAIAAAQEKQAAEITLLDFKGLGAFTDGFLLCTGFSARRWMQSATKSNNSSRESACT